MRNFWLDRKAEREAFKVDESSIELSDAEILKRLLGYTPSQVKRYLQTLDKQKKKNLGSKIILP